jgi:hypothetical protein
MTHNEQYDSLQAEYLKTRDNRTLGKMYEVAKQAAFNYLRKYCNSRGIKLDNEEMSHDAAMFVIEQYLRKPEWSVQRISAYIHFGVIKVLYRDKERETREVSYDEIIERKGDRDGSIAGSDFARDSMG